ncbi:hypothetical protein B0H63DRAFT_520797 [Podospora didyma]|uniref:Zn(2)-C6 fungal-type domain-containing protein n=1 Tax=Podospora didyma TaxID=330526 RepID=A0AAE0U0T6_9PEZI|nr:hypothetical protein B0H63DRAFT_520797 [Podospora didyma]
MKSEEDVNQSHGPGSIPACPNPESSPKRKRAPSSSAPGSGPGQTTSAAPVPQSARAAVSASKLPVCDYCRKRRIRCDLQSPCQQCQNASLTCKRDHVPRKRGPKRGHGRVINELRAQEAHEKKHPARGTSVDFDMGTDEGPQSGFTSRATSGASSPQDMAWAQVHTDHSGGFTTKQYRPTSRSYDHLIPQCVRLYYEHIYPIMPLLYMPAIREMILRPLEPSEKNLIYALSALTCFHMSGKSIQAQGPDSWEKAGRYFLDECIAVRQSYDFVQDLSISTIISSFWLSTSFFEISESRKSWYYLREALTFALDLGLQDDATYEGLNPEDALCRQRVFWQLFVTERSFAVLRNKPIVFKKTPRLPTRRHPYESPDIHSGFLQLISSYVPLDESFVAAWNDGSDPRVSATTYLALQSRLAIPPSFLARRPKAASLFVGNTNGVSQDASVPSAAGANPICNSSSTSLSDDGDSDGSGNYQSESHSEPTDIQKADLLITQQWLRLIVWQSSFKQGLLSGSSRDESMQFSFPLAIAQRTTSILATLPPSAVEVHGMGIFEKIFEIGTWCMNVLGAYNGLGSGNGGFVIGDRRKGTIAIDPLEFFVKTLSASPNSRTQFAEKLLLFASEQPGGMKMALEAPLSVSTAQAASVVEEAVEGDEEEGIQLESAQVQERQRPTELDTSGVGMDFERTIIIADNSDGTPNDGATLSQPSVDNMLLPSPGLSSHSGYYAWGGNAGGSATTSEYGQDMDGMIFSPMERSPAGFTTSPESSGWVGGAPTTYFNVNPNNTAAGYAAGFVVGRRPGFTTPPPNFEEDI